VIPIHASDGAVTFAVKVHPRARKNAITGELGDALKLSLTSPPIDGRANQACIEFFAKLLKVSRSSVTIASGHSSRNKVVRVAGLTAEELGKRIQRSAGILPAVARASRRPR
jgi:uncharacterized protein